jgi:superfamily II DNA/RNA helicase
MFDPVTEEIIAGSPDLKNLKASELVELLTSASVEIAAARLLAENLETLPDELAAARSKISRLADVFEAQVALGVNSERLRSIAFVSGSARQIVDRIDRLILNEERQSLLSEDCIGPDIASSLLFLASERFSDAAEVGRVIRATGEENALRRLLILTLGRLARGQYEDISNTEIDQVDAYFETSEELATDLLYREILQSIVMFSKFSVGLIESDALEGVYSTLQEVITLAGPFSESLEGVAETPIVALTTFPGPHHLASLMRIALGAIAENLLVSIPNPNGADIGAWRDWITKEAKRWPVIWENHKAAVATGFLDVCSSMIMTTPTGTGKSTLSGLKIAATLASGKTVLYLAPTHALVSQVEFDLNERLSELAVAQSLDELTLDETVERLPDIAVMTPEKCLALLTFAPSLFKNVGLLVFDEFHLMSADIDPTTPNGIRADRRSIDAMLCFLQFGQINESADYLLLSAMISNGSELKDWLEERTGRRFVVFDYEWKPTRQLRGCVVYSHTDLTSFTTQLNNGVTPDVSATPYGLFSLDSNWLPQANSSSALKPLSDIPMPLGIGGPNKTGFRWLTSNRNEVAAELAVRLVQHGMKVLVFCENINFTISTANRINAQFSAIKATLTVDQSVWRETAIEEVGKLESIYDAGSKITAVHHGELLPYERRLVESLFRSKESGLNVLVATSTLAQGLNLPCDAVILAGTDRLDPDTEKRKNMQEHEILNALGRAGRAGHASTGLALVVPGNPVPCDLNTYVPRETVVASMVLSSKDRCVPLIDPLCTLLDEVEVEATGRPVAEYLARKLTVSLKPNEDGTTPFQLLASRSFGYFQKRSADAANADIWLNGRKEKLEQVLSDADPQTPATWQQALAAKTGASLKFVHKLENTLSSAPWSSIKAIDWALWVLDQFVPEEEDFDAFFRPESLEKIFGRAYKNQRDLEAKRKVALEGIREILPVWFDKKNLLEVDMTISSFIAANEGQVRRPTKPDGMAKFARRFSNRFASEISFVMSAFAQLISDVELATATNLSPMPSFLPQLVRFGFPTPYHFAVSRELSTSARIEVHKQYEDISNYIKYDASDDWEAVRAKVANAMAISLFTDVSEDDLEALEEPFRKDSDPD